MSSTQLPYSSAGGFETTANVIAENFLVNGVITTQAGSHGTSVNIANITKGTSTVVYTSGIHQLSNGDKIKIEGISTTTELNNNYYYVSVLDSSTVALYTDPELTTELDSSGYTSYSQPGPRSIINHSTSFSTSDPYTPASLVFNANLGRTVAVTPTGSEFALNDFAWEAWIKDPANLYFGPTETTGIYHQGTWGSSDYFGIGGGGRYGFNFQIGTDSYYYGDYNAWGHPDLDLSSWTHIAIQRVGSTVGLWINGVPQDVNVVGNSTTGLSGANDHVLSGSNIVIGQSASGYYNGTLSQLRVSSTGRHTFGSTFTPGSMASDAYTVLLMNCQSVNPFVDSGHYHNTLTAGVVSGDPITVYADYPSAVENPVGSISFNGSSNYLEVADVTSSWAMGNTWTIEWWQNANSASNISTIYTIMCQLADSNSIDIMLTQGALCFANQYFSRTEPTPGVWTHVAVVNNGGTTNVYYNGQVTSGWSGNYNLADSTHTLQIGRRAADYQYFPGKLTGIRVGNTAVYTSNFTPPAAPESVITGTQLLMNAVDAGHVTQDSTQLGLILGGGDLAKELSSRDLILSVGAVTGGEDPGNVVVESGTVTWKFDGVNQGLVFPDATVQYTAATGGDSGGSGATGPRGATGPTGATGATGSQGNLGATGASGPAGATGSTGPTGATGAGVDGSTGATGSAGDTGATGATGDPGTPGDTGATGATGPGTDQDAQLFTTGSPLFAALSVTGDVTTGSGPNVILQPNASTTGYTLTLPVDTGSNTQLLATDGSGNLSWADAGSGGGTGATGATGAGFAFAGQWDFNSSGYNTGDVVRDDSNNLYIAVQFVPQSSVALDNTAYWQSFLQSGATGPDGATGFDGATGATGDPGTPGDVGATGDPGTPGDVGATGATGDPGTPGDTGATGPDGATGFDGATGEQGATGLGLDPISGSGVVSTSLSTGSHNFIDGVFFARGDVNPWAVGQYVTMADQTPGSTLVYFGTLQFVNQGGFGTGFYLDNIISVSGSPVGAESTSWLMSFAAAPQGATGPIGATGPQGDAGGAGADGATGATGDAGTPGDTGATGIPGDVGATGEFSGSLAQNLNLNGYDIVNSDGESALGVASTNDSGYTVLATTFNGPGGNPDGITVAGDVTGVFYTSDVLKFSSITAAEFKIATRTYDGDNNWTAIVFVDASGFGDVTGDKIYIELHGVTEIYPGDGVAIAVSDSASGRVLTISTSVAVNEGGSLRDYGDLAGTDPTTGNIAILSSTYKNHWLVNINGNPGYGRLYTLGSANEGDTIYFMPSNNFKPDENLLYVFNYEYYDGNTSQYRFQGGNVQLFGTTPGNMNTVVKASYYYSAWHFTGPVIQQP